MGSNITKKLTVFAPAKINLFLHITGKRNDGYHLLDSLVCFADIGDKIHLEASDNFSFHVDGPFARSFTAQEKDNSPQSGNLVPRAVWAFCKEVQKNPSFRITLTKNMPLGSGLGGGSSNAAATIWAMMEWWGLIHKPSYLEKLMQKLGADVPVCLTCQPARMQGIGEILTPAPDLPELFVLLVHCGKPARTEAVYKNYKPDFKTDVSIPDTFETAQDLIDFLKTTSNDLTEAAIECVPEIAFIIDSLNQQKNVLLARMSGSGSSCFALFENDEDCFAAAEKMIRENPLWWVRTGTINRTVRY